MISNTVRHAARRLLRAPAFAVAAVVTLALGIGATTAVFAVVDAVLIRPLPYPRSDLLVDLSHELTITGILHVDQSDATYLHYRSANRVFTDVGLYRAAPARIGAVEGSSADAMPAEHLAAAGVTASALRVLRAAPVRGRGLRDGDDEPGAPPVVLLGQRLWERRFGGDASIVGRRVRIDGVLREVVGIMPASFRFPEPETQLWTPLTLDPARTRSAAFDYRGIARLRDGVSIAAAAADLRRLLPEVPTVFPGRLTASAIASINMRPVVRSLRDVVVGDVGRVLWVVLGAVAFVLLIACANVANLFLVRADGRQQELRIRRVLGAGAMAVVAELLGEGALLAMAGGALGLALAAVGGRMLRELGTGTNLPRLGETHIDLLTVGVALGATALTLLVVSAWPALRALRNTEVTRLSDESRTATAGRRRHRARHVLVCAQVALALVLLAGAGLMARSFQRLRAVDPGFDAAHGWTFRVALLDADYPTAGDVERFIERAAERIAAAPGVRAVGVVTKLPLDAAGRRDTALFVEDHPLGMSEMPSIHQAAYASPEYFRAAGIPIVEGRTLETPDPARAPTEVVVSRALAARYWPGAHAVGKRVRMMPGGPWYTIVGVAGDVHGTGLDQPADETIYLPLVTAPLGLDSARWTPRDVAFVVRAAGDPSLVGGAAEGAVRAIDPSMPPFAARPMTELVARSQERTAIMLLLLGIASAVALVLGAVGIYGVVAYVVSLRTREMAVRLALGAQPAALSRLVTRQSLVVAVIGVVLGLAAAAMTTRVLAALLVGVSPLDPAALGGAAAFLLAIAAVASWIPARHAATVDPAEVLRGE